MASARRVVPAVNLAFATAALVLVLASGAPGIPATPALRLASAAGSLTIANSREGTAIFRAEFMRPAHEASGTVQIANAGTVADALQVARTAPAVDVPGAGGAGLSTRLVLRIVDATDAQRPVTVYSGRLDALPPLALGTLAAGEARPYLFAVTLPSGAPLTTSSRARGSTSASRGRRSEPRSRRPAPPRLPSPRPSRTRRSRPPAPPTVGGGTADADPTGAVLGARVFRMPSAKRCVSRRRFTIHVRRPRGLVFKSVHVTVNRRTKVKLKGRNARRIKSTVPLRGLPKGKVAVKVVAVTTTGRKALAKRTYRTYRTCALQRKR